MSFSFRIRGCLIWAITLGFLKTSFCTERFPFPGEKPNGPKLHALVGASIQLNPNKRIEDGLLLIRNDSIEFVGKKPQVPEGYREWNCTGKTIYPGFIDPYLLAGPKKPALLELGHERVLDATADLSFHGLPSPNSETARKGPGFEVVGVHPQRKRAREFEGNSMDWEKLRENGFTVAHLAPTEGIFRGSGPCVLLMDGPVNERILKDEVGQVIAFDPIGKRNSPSIYPNSLMGVIAVIRQTFWETQYSLKRIAFEKRNPTGVPFFMHEGTESLLRSLPPNSSFPVWMEPGSCLMMRKAIELGEEFSLPPPILIATGQEWRRPDLSLSPEHHYVLPLVFPTPSKLPNEEDWEQISLDQLRSWDFAPSMPSLFSSKTKSLSFTTSGCDPSEFRTNLMKAIARGLPEKAALAALTTNPAKLCGIENSVGTLEKGKVANLLIAEGKTFFRENAKLHSTWIRGTPHLLRPENEPADTNKSNSSKPDAGPIAQFPGKERKPIENPETVLFKGFKLWTCEDEGILTGQDLLIQNGKILSIGKNLEGQLPEDSKIIEGKGKHLTPGIIDCHSHAMILGGVNESTLPSTAMVRIADVVNSESINLEWQLAGGVTACNLLHGSANPIGGQNAVIKLRLGSSPMNLIMKRAPSGIKFALGENVKQANWGDKYVTRFPQSRMGVKTFFENRFNAALEYDRLKQQATFEKAPFKKNLELEAILEIIRGERLIHCHSYRQDEILVFLRTMESFGVRVASLQHVLEGYKVADEIARHGAGASTFSDWWAYKFEVYDAIPYAGALMHRRGCVVSFNSDSPDHARRLNLEAAKAVKYGKLSESEAFKFVSLNPAKQLGIDSWVGSLKVGKDADLAIWSTNPLDYRTACLETWIDGKLFHSLAHTRKRSERRAEEREALIRKARAFTDGDTQSMSSSSSEERFFRHALESACDLFPHSCRTHDCSKERKGR